MSYDDNSDNLSFGESFEHQGFSEALKATKSELLSLEAAPSEGDSENLISCQQSSHVIGECSQLTAQHEISQQALTSYNQVASTHDQVASTGYDQVVDLNSRQNLQEGGRKMVKTSSETGHITHIWENEKDYSTIGPEFSFLDFSPEDIMRMNKHIGVLALTPEYNSKITLRNNELFLEVDALNIHPTIESLPATQPKNYYKWLGDHFLRFYSSKTKEDLTVLKDCLSSGPMWNALFDPEQRIQVLLGTRSPETRKFIESLERLIDKITCQDWINNSLEFFSTCVPEGLCTKYIKNQRSAPLYTAITKVVKEAATRLKERCGAFPIIQLKFMRAHKKKVSFAFKTASPILDKLLANFGEPSKKQKEPSKKRKEPSKKQNESMKKQKESKSKKKIQQDISTMPQPLGYLNLMQNARSDSQYLNFGDFVEGVSKELFPTQATLSIDDFKLPLEPFKFGYTGMSSLNEPSRDYLMYIASKGIGIAAGFPKHLKIESSIERESFLQENSNELHSKRLEEGSSCLDSQNHTVRAEYSGILNGASNNLLDLDQVDDDILELFRDFNYQPPERFEERPSCVDSQHKTVRAEHSEILNEASNHVLYLDYADDDVPELFRDSNYKPLVINYYV